EVITRAITSTIPNVFGVGSPAYNDFGITGRKVGKVTVETKALAVAKLRATRKARHTMGTRPRAAIVAVADPSAASPDDSSAAPATTDPTPSPVSQSPLN